MVYQDREQELDQLRERPQAKPPDKPEKDEPAKRLPGGLAEDKLRPEPNPPEPPNPPADRHEP